MKNEKTRSRFHPWCIILIVFKSIFGIIFENWMAALRPFSDINVKFKRLNFKVGWVTCAIARSKINQNRESMVPDCLVIILSSIKKFITKWSKGIFLSNIRYIQTKRICQELAQICSDMLLTSCLKLWIQASCHLVSAHVLYCLVQLFKGVADGTATVDCIHCSLKLFPCYLFKVCWHWRLLWKICWLNVRKTSWV